MNNKVRKRYNLEDAIGNTYGNWEVIGLGEDKIEKYGGKRKTLRCKCNCGYCDSIIKDVIGKNVMSLRSTSCGTKNRIENGKNNRKSNNYDLENGFGIGYTKDGTKFIFDIEDYDKIKKYNWYIHSKGKYVGYLRAYDEYVDGKQKHIFMHNLIMNIENESIIDHINGDGLDNRKNNLRKCNKNDNMKNLKKYSNNKSGTKGVCYSKRECKWKSYIYVNKNRINLGTFDDIEDAIKIRKNAEIEYFGEYNREEMFL